MNLIYLTILILIKLSNCSIKNRLNTSISKKLLICKNKNFQVHYLKQNFILIYNFKNY